MNSASLDIPKASDAPERPPLPPEMIPPLVQIANFALLACLLTLVNRFIGLYIPLEKLSPTGQSAVASVYFAALLYALMRMTRAAALLPGTIPTLLISGISLAAPMGTVLLLQNQNVMPPTWLVLTANNLFLPLGVALVGTAVGRIIRHPNTLLAAAGFSVFFDIVMVTLGTVAALTATGSQIISMVSVGAGTAIPQQSAKSWAIITGVTIGPADVLFLSVFFASVFLMRLDAKATFKWIFILLFAALLEVEWMGYPVPALAPMGIAVIIANARFAAFTKREKRDLLIGAGFAVLCAGFIVWRAQSYAAAERARMVEEQKKMIGFQIGFIPASKAFAITMVVPDSRAEKTGLRAGDVVKAINGEPIAKLAEDERRYRRTLQTAAARGITLTIKSGDHPEPRDIVFPPAGSGKSDPAPLTPASP